MMMLAHHIVYSLYKSRANMPQKPLIKPRKSASQRRSRATVEAILDATAHVLVKEGYERASTNKIAAAAGVSIGSLYQYFPTKESLAAAVIDRHNHEILQAAMKVFARIAAKSLMLAIPEFIRVIVDAHRTDVGLHRVLVEQVPRAGRHENMEAVDVAGYQLIRRYLELHRDEIAVADLDTAAFICVTTVEALTHAAVVRQPHLLAGTADLFVDNVTRLITSYLKTGTA